MNVPITFPGLGAYCYEGDLTTLFQQAFSVSYVSISDSYTQIIISETTPGAADTNKVWVQINGSGTPIGFFRFASGTWQRVQGAPYYAVDIGLVNALSISFASDFTITNLASIVGRMFAVQVTNTVTGASTLTVNGLTAKPLKYLGQDTKSGHMPAGTIFVALYDGTNFQIVSSLNPIGLFNRQAYVYDYNAPTATVPAIIDFVLTRPATGVWQEFELSVNIAIKTDSGTSVNVVFSFETAPIIGSNVNTQPGIGNSGQQADGSIDNDSYLSQWRWIGAVPASLAGEVTLYFRATCVSTGGEQSASTYSGARATYQISS